MSDQPMREMRSDELVEAIERLSMYPRLIAERAYAEGLAAATPLDEVVAALARDPRSRWHQEPDGNWMCVPLVSVPAAIKATPAPLDIDAPDNANAATTSANATPAPLDASPGKRPFAWYRNEDGLFYGMLVSGADILAIEREAVAAALAATPAPLDPNA